jgi:hypothetical protein
MLNRIFADSNIKRLLLARLLSERSSHDSLVLLRIGKNLERPE